MIKCVIFDMDGTLGDTLPICIGGIRLAVQKATGELLDDGEVIKYFGASEEGIIGKLMPEHKQEGIDLYLNFYREQHKILAPRPFDGIIPLLDMLAKSGVYCAIVSGKDKVLNKLNVDKACAVYIGDAVSDIRASRKAGVAVIAAAWADSANKDALAAEKPDFLADKVSDAQEWIARGLIA